MSPKAHALLAAAGKNHEGGVPDWLVALNDIPALLNSGTTGLLGVVVMTVQPAPSFFRLSPESILRLRQQITERLMRCVRPIDRLYSISQREGLVVLPELRSSATLVMAMLKLRQQFEEVGVSIDGVTMYLEVSCGAALYPDDGEEALAAVIAGDVRPGLARLRAGRQYLNNPLWSFAFALWNVFPWLAPPMLAWRQRRHQGSSRRRPVRGAAQGQVQRV